MEDYSDHITIQQAMQLLGKSDKTIRRWIETHKLPARKIGLLWLIKRSDIEALQSGPPVQSLGTDASLFLPRIEALEREVAMLRGSLERRGASQPLPARPKPTARPTLTTEPHNALPENVPPDALHLSTFAAQHAVNRRTLLDQVKRYSLAHIAILKPNRPSEMDRYFTSEQQQAVLDMWDTLGTPHT